CRGTPRSALQNRVVPASRGWKVRLLPFSANTDRAAPRSHRLSTATFPHAVSVTHGSGRTRTGRSSTTSYLRETSSSRHLMARSGSALWILSQGNFAEGPLWSLGIRPRSIRSWLLGLPPAVGSSRRRAAADARARRFCPDATGLG